MRMGMGQRNRDRDRDGDGADRIRIRIRIRSRPRTDGHGPESGTGTDPESGTDQKRQRRYGRNVSISAPGWGGTASLGRAERVFNSASAPTFPLHISSFLARVPFRKGGASAANKPMR